MRNLFVEYVPLSGDFTKRSVEPSEFGVTTILDTDPVHRVGVQYSVGKQTNSHLCLHNNALSQSTRSNTLGIASLAHLNRHIHVASRNDAALLPFASFATLVFSQTGISLSSPCPFDATTTTCRSPVFVKRGPGIGTAQFGHGSPTETTRRNRSLPSGRTQL